MPFLKLLSQTVSVLGMTTQNVVFLIFSYRSIDKIRLKIIKSGFFDAELYCIFEVMDNLEYTSDEGCRCYGDVGADKCCLKVA